MILSYFGTADGNEYPRENRDQAVGYCTGLLAAAAISCSSSLQELLPLAVEVVLVAFRIGLLAFETRNRLESESSESASWAAIAPFNEQEANTLLAKVSPKSCMVCTC